MEMVNQGVSTSKPRYSRVFFHPLGEHTHFPLSCCLALPGVYAWNPQVWVHFFLTKFLHKDLYTHFCMVWQCICAVVTLTFQSWGVRRWNVVYGYCLITHWKGKRLTPGQAVRYSSERLFLGCENSTKWDFLAQLRYAETAWNLCKNRVRVVKVELPVTHHLKKPSAKLATPNTIAWGCLLLFQMLCTKCKDWMLQKPQHHLSHVFGRHKYGSAIFHKMCHVC